MAEASPVLLPVPAVVQTKPAKKETQHTPVAPPIIGVVLAAGSALLLHLRKDRRKEASNSLAIAELKAERDSAQKQLQRLEARLSKHLDEYTAINNSNREILDAYDTILVRSEELSSRLERAETCNRELQQKIKRERVERARCEKKIVQLQRKIEEQEAQLRQQSVEEQGSMTARSDDSAKVLEENSKKGYLPTSKGQEAWSKEAAKAS